MNSKLVKNHQRTWNKSNKFGIALTLLSETIKEINNIQDKVNKIYSFEAEAVKHF